jgi:hypothetical protein
MHATVQSFKTTLAYFASAVSNARKMFVLLTLIGPNVIKC